MRRFIEIEADMRCRNHSRRPTSTRATLVIVLLFMAASGSIRAQEQATASKSAASAPIEIPDEPRTIDPVTLVPAPLAVRATVKFDNQPLKDVFKWLQSAQTMNILVDYRALAQVKVLDTDPVSDELKNQPIYLLLNRLHALGLAWYVQDDTLQITTPTAYQTHDKTVTYNVGDLIDAGFPPRELLRTITHCTGGNWGGANASTEIGTADFIGDVIFIRQTDHLHREIAGLLTALRKHGRRTLTFDPPEHDAIRTALSQKISVDFQETPLVVAVHELSSLGAVDIRLDHAEFGKGPVRERSPISLKLDNQKLSAVLRSMLSNLGLTWYLRDGVLWIVTQEVASHFYKTAVYDVRDLCRDKDESAALTEIVVRQTRAKWQSGSERGGTIETPKPGVLVVRHTEPVLDEILQSLDQYRTALRGSKRRIAQTGPDPKEIVTGYYRLTQPLADEVQAMVQKAVFPDTWKSAERPDAVGSISKVVMQHSLIDGKGSSVLVRAEDAKGGPVVIDQVVLVIRQSRAAHQVIGKLIQTLIDSKAVDFDATIDLGKPAAPKPIRFGTELIPPSPK